MQIKKPTVTKEPEDIKFEPMDPARIGEILDESTKKHVCHRHGAIIFVGSGGGKSTTCRNQTPNSEGRTDFVDADFLYRETNAHPCQPGVEPKRPIPWWDMGDKVIHAVEKRCAMVNTAMIERGLWALTTSFTPDDKYLPTAIVILPWPVHRKRIIEKSGGKYYDGGAKATEEGFKLVLGHREWAKRVAKKNRIPIVSSIDAAIEMVRSRELE